MSDTAARPLSAAEREAGHVLVCLSASPSNSRILHAAARVARVFPGEFTALFVETAHTRRMSAEDRQRLQDNMHEARSLGAVVETVSGDDVAFEISEFARVSHVTEIFIGISRRSSFLLSRNLASSLVRALPGVDIHVIPDPLSESGFHYTESMPKKFRFLWSDAAKMMGILAVTTGFNWIISQSRYSSASIITAYLLAVLLTSVVTGERIYGLIAAAFSVVLFNFLFLEPRYTLLVYDSGYLVTYFMMFIAAFITGTLASRLKENARQSAETAYRTRVLLETSELLQKARGEEESVRVTARQLGKLMDCSVLYYPSDGKQLGEMRRYPLPGGSPDAFRGLEQEREVAEWTFANNQGAGATTEMFPQASCLYLAVRIGNTVYGVFGLKMHARHIGSFEKSVLLSILGECALALENERSNREREKAELAAQNERFRANLLRSISHDLRTPLTSISGNASNLMVNSASMDEATRKQTYSDIYDDSMWLIELVENLLSVTKLEDQNQSYLHKSTELVNEAVSEAMKHIDRHSNEHVIEMDLSEDYLFAQIDAKLIMQVVINLVNNAIKYTQPGSHIRVSTRAENGWIQIIVADDGPGISSADKSHLFEMFYTAGSHSSDSHRGLGLGLALCRSIIRAHGGEIVLTDADPHGCIFTCSLKQEEVKVHD